MMTVLSDKSMFDCDLMIWLILSKIQYIYVYIFSSLKET